MIKGELWNMESLQKAKRAMEEVILGNEEVIDLMWVALLAEGHVLFESVPGTGKTKLAKSFAKVIEGDFKRIQCTPDVLPSDVTGIRFFNPKTEDFELRVGPVVTNVLLADEINRATPKTQSSLLEVMEERQTTIDSETIEVERPFIVIATQNPVESSYGTFPLPEAQLDRFLFKVSIDYPTVEEDMHILTTYREEDPYDALTAQVSSEEIIQLQQEVKHIKITKPVYTYIVELIHASREHQDVAIGISPRGMLACMRAAQARALIHERTYVTPEDVKQLIPYVFAHRLILTMEGEMRKTVEQVVEEIENSVSVPVEFEAAKR